MRQRQDISRASLDQVERVGWWLRTVSPVLMVIGFFAVDQGGNELSGSTTEIVDQLASSQARIVIGSMIGILGAVALLGFVAALRSRLSTTSLGSWLGSVAFGSGVVMVIGAIIQGFESRGVVGIACNRGLGPAAREAAGNVPPF